MKPSSILRDGIEGRTIQATFLFYFAGLSLFVPIALFVACLFDSQTALRFSPFIAVAVFAVEYLVCYRTKVLAWFQGTHHQESEERLLPTHQIDGDPPVPFDQHGLEPEGQSGLSGNGRHVNGFPWQWAFIALAVVVLIMALSGSITATRSLRKQLESVEQITTSQEVRIGELSSGLEQARPAVEAVGVLKAQLTENQRLLKTVTDSSSQLKSGLESTQIELKKANDVASRLEIDLKDTKRTLDDTKVAMAKLEKDLIKTKAEVAHLLKYPFDKRPLYPPESERGLIVEVGNGMLSIKTASGKMSYKVSSDTKITLVNEKPGAFKDLKEGDEVIVFTLKKGDKNASTIQVQPR